MKKITPLLLLASCMLSSPVLADEPTTTVGVDNNQDVSNCSSVSQAGATSVAGVGVGNWSQIFEASHPIPYLPGTPGVTANAPTLFSMQGLPAQVKGLSLLTQNLYNANYHDVAIGSSQGTKIIFNASYPAPKPEKKNRNVYVNLDGVARGEVVGSLTVQSRKDKAEEVDFATLLYDARQYIAANHKLDGYDVTLLTVPNTVSYSMGVDGKASGMTVAPLVSGLINGPLGAMTALSTGFSRNGGITVPTARIGVTFLVLVDSGKSQVVDLREYYNMLEKGSTNGNGNGNNKKKYEAIQPKESAE
ncbi:hypothetical protein [Chlorobaculum tepidum]|nr:hypothetical protein [Chlorobaculum tepidum]